MRVAIEGIAALTAGVLVAWALSHFGERSPRPYLSNAVYVIETEQH
jgi:hypothetical protein